MGDVLRCASMPRRMARSCRLVKPPASGVPVAAANARSRTTLRSVPAGGLLAEPDVPFFHVRPRPQDSPGKGRQTRECPSSILGSRTLRSVAAILGQASGVAGFGGIGPGVRTPGSMSLPDRTAPASAPWPGRANRENRATHGPQDQAARGHQGLVEAAKTVAGQGNKVG